MLPPFRVANLRGLPDYKSTLHGKVIRLSAPTYDATLSENPQASLKYDDDDGEVVTVSPYAKLSSLTKDTN